jgi:hypothetical protein
VALPVLIAARGVVSAEEGGTVLALGERTTLQDLAWDRRVVDGEAQLLAAVAAELRLQEALGREVRRLHGEEHHDAQRDQGDGHPREPTDRRLVGDGDHRCSP